MGSYWRLIIFIKTIKLETLKRIVLGLSITLSNVLQAFLLAKIISSTFNQNINFKIEVALMLLVIIAIIKSLLIRYNEGFVKLVGAKVKGEIRNLLIDKLMNLGVGYQSNSRSGKIQSLITDGVESLETFLVNYIPQVFVSIISVIFLVTYIIKIDFLVGFIIIVSVLLAIISPHISMPFVSKSTIEFWNSYAILNSQYIDTMQGMNTLKAFNVSKKKGNELKTDAINFYKHSIRNTGHSLIDSSIIVLFMGMGTSLSIGIGAYHAIEGQILITDLVGILFLVAECMKPISDLNNYWHGSYLGFSTAEQIFEILDEKIKIEEKPNAIKEGIDYNKSDIKLENIDFYYDSKKNQILNNVNIDIKSGQQIALVGKSGSGKSTIVSLLLRFSDINTGKLTINNIDIRDYDIEYLRSNISVVFQDTYLFYGTILENISMSKPNATFEEIENVAKMANIHKYIISLESGYNTMVGERGSNLSGGQKQRIAIARALLKDAPILILDEATASVDVENEKHIQESLDILAKDKTTIVIAHRLSTIINSDKIFVLDEGKIVESGNHEELMKNKAHYTNLINAQRQGGEINDF